MKSHLGIRLDSKTLIALQKMAKSKGITVTDFVLSAISEKLMAEKQFIFDWRLETAKLLDITLGQVDYAFNNGKTTQEVIFWLNKMSQKTDLTVTSDEDLMLLDYHRGNVRKSVVIKTKTSKEANIAGLFEKLLKALTPEEINWEEVCELT